MAYFYRGVLEGQRGAPALKLTLYKVAPPTPAISYWAINDANVAYSNELVLYNGDVYPQVTTITLNLAMVTQVGDILRKPNKVKQQLKIFPKYPRKEWY